jgi:uncharacterized protein YyaL (SSP411 family)
MLLWALCLCAHDVGGAAANRLIHERSPYLQQHAHNPVDWFPWGPEALEKARRERKPILLSIGYSTCHWCHVMERESFEDEPIAALLNTHFVPIKVDREERPDLDHLYMTAVQAMTGQGGWPLTVFLTPRLEPFFGGTYFPPDDRWGRPGFRSILERVAASWADERAGLEESAGKVTTFLREQAGSRATDGFTAERARGAQERALENLKASYDEARGGFGGAPKFPTPHVVSYLLRAAQRRGDAQAEAMAIATLDAMAAGGIHDQLGGGFHRYATGADWLVPHFEKMLYDQAGLALAYTDAWLLARAPRHAEVVRDILDYVLRDLTHPEGGFYSAEDADSEGEEGTFYVWTADEIRSHLGDAAGHAFAEAFGVTPGGNWEGRNILHRRLPLAPLPPQVAEAGEQLRTLRAARPRPARDEKVIAAWNGFMIEAFARAGRALGEPRYVAAAERAADFAARHLWRDERLMRHFRDGQSHVAGYLDDYAFLGQGLLALYESSFRVEHLRAAVEIARELVRLFGAVDGALAYARADAEGLPAPVLDVHDGAMPSASTAAVAFLLRLGHLTADQELIDRAWAALGTLAERIERSPGGHVALLSAVDFTLGPVAAVVLAGDLRDPAFNRLRATIDSAFLPNVVVAHRPPAGGDVQKLIPYLERQVPTSGTPTAFVCSGYACRAPVTEVADLAEQLGVPRP